MADPFVAEIRIVPFNFAPKGWACCDGQMLPTSQNTALFSLLGTTYGGDGMPNFALPDLRGRAPMHPGQGQGLSPHSLGERGGSETVTLTEAQIPAHTHATKVSSSAGAQASPENAFFAAPPRDAPYAASSTGTMAPAACSSVGGQPHNNMQPCLTVNFCIALQGVFPPRS